MGLKDLFKKHKNNVVINNGEQIATIKVANGYEPNVIQLQKGIPTKLIFKRTNESACLAKVQSSSLAFNKELPLNQNIEITINTSKPGEYDYACGMNMFHGKVVIK